MINQVNAPEKLYIVLPCYNESVGLENSISEIDSRLCKWTSEGLIAEGSSMLFVDDGSKDGTWELIARNHESNPRVKGIRFAANRGKEYALYAGLMEARLHADIIICMDADLQHDIDAIPEFLKKRGEGYELIYGLKAERGKEPFIRKITAAAFYKFMTFLGSPVLSGHSDYSLMTRQVVDALAEYGECNMMFRAILYQLGFKQCPVYFNVKQRNQGESKMSMRKLLSLSIDAITSFSVTPLRIIGLLGIFIFLASIFMIGWIIYDFITIGPPDGWSTITCSIWLLGGLIMISLSIVGEYIGRVYTETKRRPRFFVKTRLI